MIAIKSHELEPVTEAELERLVQKPIEEIIRGWAKYGILGGDPELFLIHAGRFAGFGRFSDSRTRLAAAADMFGVQFLASGAPGELLTFCVNGKEHQAQGGELSGSCHAYTWFLGYCLALAFRKKEVLAILDAYDRPKILAAPAPTYDLYALSMMDALRELGRGTEDWKPHLEEAEFRSRPENLRIGTPRTIAYMTSLLPILRAIGTRDQALFESACADAIKLHKKTYDRAGKRHHYDGAFCWRVAGLAALGVDRGLSYGIDSGYAPRWLVFNTEP